MKEYLITNRVSFTKEEKRIKFISYYNFIESNYWLKQKEYWYSRHNKLCAICKTDKYVNLHHKIYPRNNRYLSLIDNAFICLCRKHHFQYHKIHGVKRNMCGTTNSFYKKSLIII